MERALVILIFVTVIVALLVIIVTQWHALVNPYVAVEEIVLKVEQYVNVRRDFLAMTAPQVWKKLPLIYLNACTLYIIITTNFYSNAGLYQVRLNNAEIAEIYYSGMWIPICGHYFWNNNNGATLFCQQLGYQMGEIKQETISRQVPLPNDGFVIGSCNENDIWPQCTGGCSEWVGECQYDSDCQSGVMAGLKIECST